MLDIQTQLRIVQFIVSKQIDYKKLVLLGTVLQQSNQDFYS